MHNHSVHIPHPEKKGVVYIAMPDLQTIKPVSEDEPHTMWEVLIPQVGGAVVHARSISIHNASPENPILLGNHYHDVDESFAIASGEPEVTAQVANDPDAPV
jgi:hypothetical protein